MKKPAEFVYNHGCEPNKCTICYQQFFLPLYSKTEAEKDELHEVVNDQDAAINLRNLVQSIEADRQQLIATVGSSGDTIIKRWKKKSKDQKTATLRNRDEQIARKAVLNKLVELIGPLHVQKEPNAVLLPWLNVESLLEDPSRLFSLIQYRAFHHPSSWMLFDSLQLNRAHLYGIELELNSKAVMMTEEKYGELVDWDHTQANSWESVGYPRAQLILRAQRNLLKYLREVVTDIVKEPAEKPVDQPNWEALRQTDFLGQDEEPGSYFQTLPFTEPPSTTFDLEKYAEVIMTNFEEAWDDFKRLQISPKYVEERMKSQKLVAIGKPTNRRGLVHETTIFIPVMRSFRWLCLGTELTLLAKLENTDPDYELRLASIEALIEHFMSHVRMEFDKSFGDVINYNPKPPSKYEPDFFVDAVHNLARGNFWSSPAGFIAEHRFMSDCLDSSSVDQRGCLNPVIMQCYREMCSLAEMLCAVHFRRPRILHLDAYQDRPKILSLCPELGRYDLFDDLVVASFDPDNRFSYNDFMDGLAQKLEVLEKFPWPLEVKNTPKTKVEVAAVLKKYPWPPETGADDKGKKQNENEKWLAKANKSRTALAEYWDALRRFLREEWVATGVDVNFANILIDAHFRFTEQEQYVQDRNDELERIKESGNPAAVTTAAPTRTPESPPASPISPLKRKLDATGGDEPEAKFTALKRRVKEKTRPEKDDEPDDGLAAEPEEEEAPPPKPKVLLKNKRSKTTLQQFWPSDEHSQEVKWTDFVAAMKDAEFAMTSNAGGSYRRFTHADGRFILVHAPHPDKAFRPDLLRVIKHKLESKLGWDEDIFEIKPKV